MFDCRDLRERSCSCAENGCGRNDGSRGGAYNRCIGIVALILASLFFFVAGIIVGAFLAIFVITSIVPIAILALVLLLALFITLFIARCENRNNRC